MLEHVLRGEVVSAGW